MGINLCTLVMTCPTEKYNPRDMTLHCKRELCLLIGVNLYETPASKKPCCIVGGKSVFFFFVLFFFFCPESKIALVKILILTSVVS